MARKYYGKKKTLKMVGAIAGAVVLTLGAVAGVNALVENSDDTERVFVNYAIGGLNATDGKYEESEKTLYTEKGFSVEDKSAVVADIKFNATVSYQLFYYGENDTFISASEVLTEDSTDEVPEGALTCRVEITPIWGSDVKNDDKKVTVLNKTGFASQLKLSVEAAEEVEETPEE